MEKVCAGNLFNKNSMVLQPIMNCILSYTSRRDKKNYRSVSKTWKDITDNYVTRNIRGWEIVFCYPHSINFLNSFFEWCNHIDGLTKAIENSTMMFRSLYWDTDSGIDSFRVGRAIQPHANNLQEFSMRGVMNVNILHILKSLLETWQVFVYINSWT